MKNLKLSFALIVAVMAVGITVATKANFGKRVVTRCFFDIQLINASGTGATSIDAFLTPRLSCATAVSRATASPYITNADVATSFLSSASCPDETNFCCARVTEVLASDPGFDNAVELDLGEGLKKYKIANPSADIFCKED